MQRRLRHLTLLAALVVIAGTAVFAASASAGTYTALSCTASPDHQAYGWTSDWTAGDYWYMSTDCSSYGMYSRFDLNQVPSGAAVGRTYRAPTDTWISSITISQFAAPRSPGAYDVVYADLEDTSRRTLGSAVGDSGATLVDTTYSLPQSGPHAVAIRAEMGCQSTVSSCPVIYNNQYANEYYLYGASVQLNDPYTPTFASVTGSGWQATPVDGVDQINYAANDRGAGILSVRLFVDGVNTAVTSTRCTSGATVPCPLSHSGSFALDTTRLSEGQHTAALVVSDYSGNANPQSAQQLTFTVRRPPSSTTPPGTTDTTWNGGGSPAPGDQMGGNPGSWSGTSNSYTYEWMRCDAQGLNCVAIPGATTVGYTITTADIGHTLMFCVIATNSGGTVTECSAPTAVVVAAHPTTTTTSGDASSTSTGGTDTSMPTPAAVTATSPSEPSASSRGAANGSPASDRVVLTAFVNSRTSSRRVKFGKRVAITGRLVGPNGVPIAGAVIAVETQTAVPGAAMAAAGQVVTGSDGRFRYAAPAGPSRVVRFGYRSYTADTSFADTTDVHLLVTACVTMRAGPRKVHNRHATVFTGRLLGGPRPRRGVVIDLQVFFRGQWRTFATPRTNRKGAYRFRYRFMAGAATWKFRARVRADASYPYVIGYSRKRVKVRVLD